MTLLKTFVLSFLLVPTILFVGVLACKGEELEPTMISPEIIQSVDGTTFEKDYNSILDSEQIETCAEYEKLTCLKTKPLIKYLYISDVIVEQETNEQITERTPNTKVFDQGGQTVYRIYGGQPFIKVDDTWYQTETEYITPEIFDQVTADKLTFLNQVIKNNPLKIYSVNAQDIYYSGASGDGRVYHLSGDPDWATVRDATDGTGKDDDVAAENCVYAGLSGGNYYIARAFFPIDTTAVEGTVESASFFFKYASKTDNDSTSAVLTEASQTSTSGLATDDYNNVGFTSGGSILFSALSNSAYNEIELNATGIGWINNAGYTKLAMLNSRDQSDTAPTGMNYLGDVKFSESTGTGDDPYLEIVEAAAATSTPPAATSTIGFLYPDNMCVNDDLSVICGMTQHYETSTATPDWVEYHYYHIPFIVWLIIAGIWLWIVDRIILELIIRWRTKKSL